MIVDSNKSTLLPVCRFAGFFLLVFWQFNLSVQATQPSIAELQKATFLDDYYSNVLLGYQIVNDTKKYAHRYAGNQLSCRNCHLESGTKANALPLNVAGMYPKWRAKNHQRNGIGLRIRECFLYSMNGILPPADAPEVLAVAAYISYLSFGETIGKQPEGRGVPVLEDTGFDPNPASGQTVYKNQCAICHGEQGEGTVVIPALWGSNAYNAGAGMHNIDTAAGFIWANMPPTSPGSLSIQEAKDVAAYINLQYRPGDPRDSKLLKLIERITRKLSPKSANTASAPPD